MKFNTIISYFFLLLLAFAQIADTSSATKIARNKLQSLNKSHSHAKSARRANKRSTTLTKKNVMLNDPENTYTLIGLFEGLLANADKIFEFVMGFICEHIKEICTIYKKIKQIAAVYTNVKGCFTTIQNTGKTITGALDRATQDDFIKVQIMGEQAHGDELLCKSVKVEIKKTQQDQASLIGKFFSEIASHYYGNFLGSLFGTATTVLSNATRPFVPETADTMCSLAGINQQRRGDLNARFGSLEAYKEQCIYFAKQDCTKFNPSTANLNEFFKKAWGIASSVKDSVKCIAETVKSITDLFDVSELIKKWLLKLAANAGISVVANALTLGIWAGIKAVYYIVKLGIRIHTFIKAWIDGTPDIFALGQIIANAVSIVQSLLAMRRRKRKLMK